MTSLLTEQRLDLWRLLEARIAFRRRWIDSQAPKRKQVKPEHVEALNAYDDENNFARMGVEYVDHAWGFAPLGKPRKPQKRRADTIRAAVIAASALNPHPRHTGARA